MIGYPVTLTNSGQRYHHFGPSSSTNNDTETLQTVVAALHIRQKPICEFCEIIGHKSDAWIIRGLNFLPPYLRKILNSSTPFMVMNQLIHQKRVTSNLQKFNSNPRTLLPKLVLWF